MKLKLFATHHSRRKVRKAQREYRSMVEALLSCPAVR